MEQIGELRQLARSAWQIREEATMLIISWRVPPRRSDPDDCREQDGGEGRDGESGGEPH